MRVPRSAFFVAIALASGCELVAGLGDDRHLAPADASTADSPPPPPTDAPAPPPPSPVDAGDADAPFEAGPPPYYVEGNAATTADAGTAAVTLMSTVVAGNTLLVAVDYNMGTTIMVTDSRGDAFTQLLGWDSADTGLSYWLGACVGAKGGVTTVNVQLGAPTDQIDIWAHEYGNVGSFEMGTAANGTDLSTNGMKTPPITTTVPNELIFGWAVTGSASPGTGFTLRSNFDTDVTEDMLAPTPGAYRATATMTSGASWSMMGVALKPR